jgi:hypothetical protein
MHRPAVLFALVAVTGGLRPPLAAAAEPTPAQVEFFENKVRPVLAEHCFKCHGDKKEMAGLRLDSAAAVKKGSENGPVVVPGEPAKSPLVKSVRRETDSPMPPNKPLPPDAVAVLAEWVQLGAPFPADAAVQKRPDAATTHWAFQPVRNPAPPAVGPGRVVNNDIDRFVAAKLDAANIPESPPADRRTLIRRVSADLVGLPPTAEQADAFEADRSPDAYEKLVDRLLASPQFGEKWARHWLDLARYSDTKGYVFTEDPRFPYAYTYRDYVIRAFNEDKPYDRLVIEQIAADKLDLGSDKRPLAAMGYLTLGRRFLNNTHDIIDDRMDVVTRGFLGLTVQCARCHDHKFDPIPQADYYSLYGVFASSTEPKELPLIGEPEQGEEYRKFEAELAKLEAAVADLRTRRTAARTAVLGGLVGPGVAAADPRRVLNRADQDEIGRLQRKADALRASSPAAPPRAMVLADAPGPTDPVVFLRGNPGNPGPRVPRRFLAVATVGERKPFTQGSGRLELAKAIADPKNPLTARVMANRVWAHLFGAGLVRTPSDFGLRSDPPTHPELLDHLAARFAGEDGWSVKKLIRRMVLSAAYRRSSELRPEQAKADPENRLLARANRKRLDFEGLRDAILSAAGTLDLSKVGGRSVDLFKAPFPKRRSVYGHVDRQNLPGTFRAFDFASPDQHTPQRFRTTVPQQALFLMNSPFVAEAAQAVAARPAVAAAAGPAAKATAVYRAVLGRSPAAPEATAAAEFLAAGTPDQLAQVLLLSNEFAFVD